MSGFKTWPRDFGDDRGFSAIWVAVVALFLVGAAALAVDTSGAFNVAQTDQNTADLSCLAGVKEIPADPVAGINLAVSYAVDNWPEMAGNSTSISGTTGTYSNGAGNEVFVDAAYGGDDSKMYVRVTEIGATFFGKAMGQDSVTVVQEASCYHQEVRNGTGMLPIGALAGSWDGDLFDCANDKVSGNCGALDPAGGGANAYRDSVANGIEGEFIKHHGPQATPDPDTGNATIDCFAEPCNVSKTKTGNMEGPWAQGLELRFSDVAGADCVEDGVFNCDSVNQVFGAGLQPLSAISEPSWWEDSLYGPFATSQAATAPDARHYFYNGTSMKCDSPRIGTVPIVSNDLDWDIGFGKGTFPPNGKKNMKMIGFYTIYIVEPDSRSDIGKKKTPMQADIVWFGPEATCEDGTPFQPLGSSDPIDTGVRLVAP